MKNSDIHTWYNNYVHWSYSCVQEYYNYVENVRKRKSVALVAILQLKKRKYSKKNYWVAPIFQERPVHGFFHFGLPKLILEDLRFHNYIRMSAAQLEKLINVVAADIYKQNCIKEFISVAERLLLTLRFLASGDSIHSMSYQYLVGVTTAANIISETSKAIWDNLSSIVANPDFTVKRWLSIAKDFKDKWNFPHCIGAIDGKHIVIQCPPKAGSSYYNYKGSHSVVLLAICDANYIFTIVDIGAYGRRSDGGIFKKSEVGQKFENNEMKVPPWDSLPNSRNANVPYCLVGDEEFPLKTYMLSPYPGKDNAEMENRVFNYRLSRARRTIENSFGILANRWRIFRNPIIMSVENGIRIVQACVCLHNWLHLSNLDEEENVKYFSPGDHDSMSENLRRNIADSRAFTDITRTGSNIGTSMQIRDTFRHYFNNE